MKRSSIKALGMLVLVGVGGVLGGCAQGCSAVGLYDVVTVELEGDATEVERVAWVELCVDAVCGSSTGQFAAGPPSSPDPRAPYTITVGERELWAVDVEGASADVTATAHAADGSALGATSETLTWDPETETRSCPGGPVEGGPMVVTLG